MKIIPILALTALGLVKPAAEPAAPKPVPPGPAACLNTREMREAIDDRRAVQPLVALKAAGNGERIRAQLCRTETGLVYLITTLGRDGHVARVVVDAQSGERVGAH